MFLNVLKYRLSGQFLKPNIKLHPVQFTVHIKGSFFTIKLSLYTLFTFPRFSEAEVDILVNFYSGECGTTAALFSHVLQWHNNNP